MSRHLIDGLVTTDAIAAAFDDESIAGAMLEFEGALARSEATCGVIPDAAAVAIGDVSGALRLDPADMLSGRAAGRGGLIAVAVRRTPGGPAPETTEAALAASRTRLEDDRATVDARQALLRAADRERRHAIDRL